MTFNCSLVITLNVSNDANDHTRRDSKIWGGPVSLLKTTSGVVATSRSLPDVTYVASLFYVEGEFNGNYCGFNVAELTAFLLSVGGDYLCVI
jgi:hypothetical protein